MPRTSGISSLWWLAGPLLAALACSHDSPRDNPLDPTLTPPVELQVALDDTAGTATLTWTPYEGEQPFARYLVQRRVRGMELWSTLDSLGSAAQVAYRDTTLAPDIVYEYRVAVANASGYAALSNRETVAGFTVGAVQLLATESDPEAGVIKLRWSRYHDPAFTSYRVVRRQVGTDRDTTLYISHSLIDTAFADTTALHEVSYTYTVQVTAAGQELPSGLVTAHLSLPGVTITKAQFISQNASCSLAWTPYRGPRFGRYRVVRLQEGLAPRAVGEIPSSTVTTFTDTGLHGNTEYAYQVVVLTEAGEEVRSEERHGLFHRLVGMWPLQVAEGAFVRLYAESDGRIAALIAEEEGIRLRWFEPSGAATESLLLTSTGIEPRSVSMYTDPSVGRLVSVSFATTLGVMSFTMEGVVVTAPEAVLFDWPLPDVEGAGHVPGQIALVAAEAASEGTGGWVSFDNVSVSRNGQVIWEDTYDMLDPSRLLLQGSVADGRLIVPALPPLLAGTWRIVSRKAEESWSGIRLQAEVTLSDAGAGIQMGTTTVYPASRLTLRLIPGLEGAELRWNYRGSRELTSQREESLAAGHASVLEGVPYRISLEVSEGRARATAVGVKARVVPVTEDPWATLLGVGGAVGVLIGTETHAIAAGDFIVDDRLGVGAGVSEIRSVVGSLPAFRQTVACEPFRNRVVRGRFFYSAPTGDLRWTNAMGARVFGYAMGNGDGELLSPMSADIVPDGRVLVLDAGNSRIQVYDGEGKYVTQWGGKGIGEGEFDFGRGYQPEAFRGSICVDDEGYIYVADVLNQRIQVFAP